MSESRAEGQAASALPAPCHLQGSWATAGTACPGLPTTVPALAQKVPCPRSPPVLGEWGGWTSFAQALEGLWAPRDRPPEVGSSWDPTPTPWDPRSLLSSPQALGPSSISALGKPIQIHPPAL